MKRQTIRFYPKAWVALVRMVARATLERGHPVSINAMVNELIIAANAAKGENENERVSDD